MSFQWVSYFYKGRAGRLQNRSVLTVSLIRPTTETQNPVAETLNVLRQLVVKSKSLFNLPQITTLTSSRLAIQVYSLATYFVQYRRRRSGGSTI